MNGRIILNEDNSHYFYTRAVRDADSAAADVDAWADQYAGTQVGELVLCVSAMKANFDSRVLEPIWAGFDPEQGEEQPLFASEPAAARSGLLNWARSAWQLHQYGIDAYERWIDRSRAAGISPWISVRMNDVHSVNDEDSFMHSTLWRTRPDLRRVGYKFDRWTDKALDYGQREVRDRALAFLREIAERYDLDGLELDWMRFGFHFRPGFEDEGAALLNEFVRNVRLLLDEQGAKRGRRIKLSVRVPSRPDASLALGIDAVEWARRGWIDQVVAAPFWETTDTDIPIELWKQLLHGTPVVLAAGLELLVRAYPASELRHKNTPESVRGAAISFLSRGADRIYLFNYMDSHTAIDEIDAYPGLLRELGSLDTLRGKPRRHIVTYADTRAPGQPAAALLPLRCVAGSYANVRIHLGERPDGQRAEVRLGFEGAEAVAGGEIEVRVNGVRCEYAGQGNVSKPNPDKPVMRYAVPDAALKDGVHVIDIRPTQDMTLVWAEIAVR